MNVSKSSLLFQWPINGLIQNPWNPSLCTPLLSVGCSSRPAMGCSFRRVSRFPKREMTIWFLYVGHTLTHHWPAILCETKMDDRRHVWTYMWGKSFYCKNHNQCYPRPRLLWQTLKVTLWRKDMRALSKISQARAWQQGIFRQIKSRCGGYFSQARWCLPKKKNTLESWKICAFDTQ